MTPQNFVNIAEPNSPGIGSALVIPSDTVNFTDVSGGPKVARSLYVETAGAVCFVGIDGQADTWNVPANFTIPVACLRVNITGTTGGLRIHAVW
jgi:hypothetical protein